jgi:hypothetical protein
MRHMVIVAAVFAMLVIATVATKVELLYIRRVSIPV